MTNINTYSQKMLQDRLKAQAKAGKAGFEQAFADATLGKGKPSDEQFKLWFDMHSQPITPAGEVNPYFNPNWAPALQYVEGGKEMLRRYARIVMPPEPKPEMGRGSFRNPEPFRPTLEVGT